MKILTNLLLLAILACLIVQTIHQVSGWEYGICTKYDEDKPNYEIRRKFDFSVYGAIPNSGQSLLPRGADKLCWIVDANDMLYDYGRHTETKIDKDWYCVTYIESQGWKHCDMRFPSYGTEYVFKRRTFNIMAP